MRGLSLVVASGGHSSLQCAGLSLSWPLVAEHRLQTCRLSNCGSRAQLLRGMWDLPRPGLEPVSPALAGRFSTTVPPGKPYAGSSLWYMRSLLWHAGSLVVACMWELVPSPGTEPRPPSLGAQSLTHWTTREVPIFLNKE